MFIDQQKHLCKVRHILVLEQTTVFSNYRYNITKVGTKVSKYILLIGVHQNKRDKC